jgi:hypothetical protein
MFRTVYLGCLCLIASAAFGSEGTTVYKSEDKSVNPVFSDQKTATSEAIKIKDPMTFPGAAIKKDAEAFNYGGIRSESASELPVVYDTLLISNPEDQQTIRDNAGNLMVEVVAPRNIASEHQLELLIDGNVVSIYDGNGFDLKNLDRGTHELQLQISHTESGEVYKSSPVVSFTMLRYSQRSPRKPTPH